MASPPLHLPPTPETDGNPSRIQEEYRPFVEDVLGRVKAPGEMGVGWKSVAIGVLNEILNETWVAVIAPPGERHVKGTVVTLKGRFIKSFDVEFPPHQHTKTTFNLLGDVLDLAIGQRVRGIILDVQQSLVRGLVSGDRQPGSTLPFVRMFVTQLGRAEAVQLRVRLVQRERTGDFLVDLTRAL